MPVVFAAAVGHAPGITAWRDAALPEQRTHIDAAFATLARQLREARADILILLTSEHWTNFFLDHIGAFCVGRNDQFRGPVEPWLGIPDAVVSGAPELASTLIESAYDRGFEVSFGYDLAFDHGSMVPLHFLTPRMDLPVVPIFFNTLAAPQPSAARAFGLGTVVGELARTRPERIAVVASGGMSHDPGERNHGHIDTAFDRTFLDRMVTGDDSLRAYTNADFMRAGAGSYELLAWIALRGAIGTARGRVLAYEAVVPWATGIGLMAFELAGNRLS